MYYIKTINNTLYQQALPELRGVKSLEELEEKLNQKSIPQQKSFANTLFLIKKDLKQTGFFNFILNLVIAFFSLLSFIIFSIWGKGSYLEIFYVFVITLACTLINTLLETRVWRLRNKKNRQYLLLSFFTLSSLTLIFSLAMNFILETSFLAYAPIIVIILNSLYFVKYFINLEDQIYEEDLCGFIRSKLFTQLERGFTLVWALNIFFVIFISSNTAFSALSYLFLFLFILTSVGAVKHFMFFKQIKFIMTSHL